MNNQLTRFALTAAFSVAALASVIPFAGSAHAAGDLADWRTNYGNGGTAASDADVDGRDFMTWRRTLGTANVQFNPKELTVEQSVPWK